MSLIPFGSHADMIRRDYAIKWTYEDDIVAWAVENGCERGDLTPSQLDRFKAWVVADGDIRAAAGLIYGQMLYDTERIRP